MMKIRFFVLALAVAMCTLPACAATLADLGFANGISLRGPGGSAEVYFPMPPGAKAPRLILDMTASPALDRLSSLTILVAGETVATVPAASGGKPIEIAIPERLLRGGFAGVRFAADQALRRGEACFDNDTPAVWTRVGPDTRIEATPAGPAGIGGVWQSLAGRVSIGLPATPSAGDIQTALTLAVALTQRGALPVMVDAATADAAIVIGPAPASLSLQTPVRADRLAALRVSTPEAARALVAASPAMMPLASVNATSRVISPPGASGDGVSFAAMALHPPSVAIASLSSITFEVPFHRLPAGQHPVALQLFGRGAALPADETLIASVVLGPPGAGQLVWSRTFRGDVDLDGDVVPIPAGVLYHRMPVTLQLVRAGGRHACGSNDTLLFQLRDTSRVLLAAGAPAVRSFGNFAIPRDRAALVRLDAPTATIPPFIPLMARILADAGARAGAIDAGPSGTALDRPFLTIGFNAPAEIAETAPVRPDQGHVVLTRPAAGVRVELAGADAMTVAQVVRAKDGVAGIWLSTGSAVPPETVSSLSTGNVAVFAASGAEAALFDTLDPEVIIENPRVNTLDTLLLRWRTELFLLAWIVVTLVAVAIVIRLRRPTNKP